MPKHKGTHRKSNLSNDIGVIITSIFVAILLVRTGTITAIISQTAWLGHLQAFIAGFFFTSIFTTAPAIAALSQLAQGPSSILPLAVFGALGAVCGDMIIYHFSRDTLARDISALVSVRERRRLRHIFHLRLFRWLFSLVGGIIIASPLPDELGLLLMGIARPRISTLVPISFAFNFLGIIIIATIAQTLAS